MGLVERLGTGDINGLLLESVGSQFRSQPTIMTLDRAKTVLGGLDQNEVSTLQAVLNKIDEGAYDWNEVRRVATLLEVNEYSVSEAKTVLQLN